MSERLSISRESDVPFSPDEVQKIRQSVRSAYGPILCPRCGTPLSTQANGSNTLGHYWLYRCPPCRAGITLGDVE